MNAPHLFNRALLDISTWDIFISGESPCHGHENRDLNGLDWNNSNELQKNGHGY